MKPGVLVVNFTPSSYGAGSPESAVSGAALPLHREQGHVRGATVTVTAAPGDSRLPLSSTDRARIVADPLTEGVHAYDQLERPGTWCHDVPLSTETSTPATRP